MRRIICITLLAGLLAGNAYGQTILNGSFENTTAMGCSYNLSDQVFNINIQDVHAFGGSFGELDMMTTGCYVIPQDGNWCVGLDSDTIPGRFDAISLTLSSPLLPGRAYRLQYYVYGNTNFARSVINVEVGESLTDDDFGNLLHTATPTANAWTLHQLTFVATRATAYITVRSQADVEGWPQVDNFSLSTATGFAAHDTPAAPLRVYPNPATDFVTVSLTQALRGATYELLDAQGRLIRRGGLAGDLPTLSVAELAPGLYLLKVQAGAARAWATLVKP